MNTEPVFFSDVAAQMREELSTLDGGEHWTVTHAPYSPPRLGRMHAGLGYSIGKLDGKWACVALLDLDAPMERWDTMSNAVQAVNSYLDTGKLNDTNLDTITLNQEMPGGSDNRDQHGWVLRSGTDDIAVWGGDIEDVDGAQAWATATLVGLRITSWTQDAGCSDCPYWTPVSD